MLDSGKFFDEEKGSKFPKFCWIFVVLFVVESPIKSKPKRSTSPPPTPPTGFELAKEIFFGGENVGIVCFPFVGTAALADVKSPNSSSSASSRGSGVL